MYKTILAVSMASVFLLTACGGSGGGSSNPASSNGGGASGGDVTFPSDLPQFPETVTGNGVCASLAAGLNAPRLAWGQFAGVTPSVNGGQKTWTNTTDGVTSTLSFTDTVSYKTWELTLNGTDASSGVTYSNHKASEYKESRLTNEGVWTSYKDNTSTKESEVTYLNDGSIKIKSYQADGVTVDDVVTYTKIDSTAYKLVTDPAGDDTAPFEIVECRGKTVISGDSCTDKSGAATKPNCANSSTLTFP